MRGSLDVTGSSTSNVYSSVPTGFSQKNEADVGRDTSGANGEFSWFNHSLSASLAVEDGDNCQQERQLLADDERRKVMIGRFFYRKTPPDRI